MILNGNSWSQKQFVDNNFVINDSDGWKSTDIKSKSIGKTEIINGNCYKVVDKKERHLPLFSLQRVVGIIKGLFLSVISLGMAPIFSKLVRQMFSGRQTLKILVPDDRVKVEPKIADSKSSIPCCKSAQGKTSEKIREMAKENTPIIAFLRDKQIEAAEKRRENEIKHLNNITALEKTKLETEETVALAHTTSVGAQKQIRKDFAAKKAALRSYYQGELAKIEKNYAEDMKAANKWYQQKLSEVTARTDTLIAQKEENQRKADKLNERPSEIGVLPVYSLLEFV